MDEKWKAHIKPVYSVAFSPCGKMVATAGGDELTCVWEIESQTKLHEFPGSSVWAPVTWSADGKYIARGGYGVEMWDANSGASLFRTKEFTEAIAFTPDRSVFIVHGNSGTPLRRWTVPGFKEMKGGWGGVRTGSQFPTGGMAIHPNGEMVVTTFGINPGRDGFYSVGIIWNQKGEELGQLWPGKRPPHHATELKFSPDGRFLAGVYGPVLLCWDIAEKRELYRIQPGKTHFKGLDFTKDGERLLAANTDKQLRVYSTKDGAQIETMDPGVGKLGGFAISSDGTRACVGGHLGKIRVWDL